MSCQKHGVLLICGRMVVFLEGVDMRESFEKWATSPPREWSVSRLGEDSASWPGHYYHYHVQCAWEAWQEAIAIGLNVAEDE